MIHFRFKDAYKLKVKGRKKKFHANGNQKTARIAMLILVKTDSKPKMVIRDKEHHDIMLKRPTHQEDITIVNIYVPNIIEPKYIKQILTYLKREVDNNIVIPGN